MFSKGVFLFVLLFAGNLYDAMNRDFDIQGHRGARGLLPENTIPSFLKAVDLGMHTIEFDVVISSDQRVVVSHEPWFHHHICSTPDGVPVSEAEQLGHNIYEMAYEQIARYDCGRRGHVQFPEQQPIEVSKPLMTDAVRAIEAYVAEQGLEPVRYNIESKSRPEWDHVFHPGPETFTRLIYDELAALGVLDRVIFQSFDPRTLQVMRSIDPDVTLALLIGTGDDSIQEHLERLGFVPEIYSPHYGLVDQDMQAAVHDKGMKLIVWTVNEVEVMEQMWELGVDGLITDYPDRARFLLDRTAG